MNADDRREIEYKRLQKRALRKLYVQTHGRLPVSTTELAQWMTGGVCTLDPYTVLDEREIADVLRPRRPVPRRSD